MSLVWKFDEHIKSDPGQCAAAVKALMAQLDHYGWTDKEKFAIHMALEEAIINGIKHGNGSCPKTSVRIEIELDDRQFQAIITDEGAGFDLASVPDPTANENLEKCSGRGVMLIQHFVDEVEYNQCGNSVCLRKKKANPPPELQ